MHGTSVSFFFSTYLFFWWSFICFKLATKESCSFIVNTITHPFEPWCAFCNSAYASTHGLHLSSSSTCINSVLICHIVHYGTPGSKNRMTRCGLQLSFPLTWIALFTQDSHKDTTTSLSEEIKGSWCDLLLSVLRDEWRNCKRGIIWNMVETNW